MTRKGWTVVLVMVALLVLAVGARAMAQDGEGESERRTITVTSTASVGTAPDQATLQLGIETQAEDSTDALADNARVSDDVLVALEDAGVAEADVQTDRIDVHRRTIDRRTPQERTVFVADSTLAVTVRSVAPLAV